MIYGDLVYKMIYYCGNRTTASFQNITLEKHKLKPKESPHILTLS